MTHAVIGTGYWGTNHVRVAAELAEEGVVDDLVLCDLDERRVSDLAESYGVEYVTDTASLAAHGVETAVVATPSTTHHDIATALLREGVDCLVEKPLALTSEAAWSMVETAETHGRTLGVGHIFRYHPALRELKRRIDRGELGRIKYLTTDRYTLRAPRAETGVLYSLAVHDVDVYSYLLDQRPTELFCRLDSHLREGVDETATLVLEYGNGATGVINESWQVPVFGKKRDLVVVGSERAAHIDYLEDTELRVFDSKVVRHGEGFEARDEGVTTYEVEGYEPLKIEVETFVEACAGDADLPATGRVGAETVDLLERAEESAAEGANVRL